MFLKTMFLAMKLFFKLPIQLICNYMLFFFSALILAVLAILALLTGYIILENFLESRKKVIDEVGFLYFFLKHFYIASTRALLSKPLFDNSNITKPH